MEFHPLTPERWDDFEKLFGPKGAYAGCWCMWWRSTRAEFQSRQGEGNRLAMRSIVESGRVPGILGCIDGVPVAWCSVAPRSDFGALERSRVLKPIDDTEVWSIVCFFISKEHRGAGMLELVIRGAVDYVRRRGGRVVEAYPTATTSGSAPPTSTYMGLPAVFERVGFVEVARPSKSKRVLRYRIPDEPVQT
jgi:hypothetical protein